MSQYEQRRSSPSSGSEHGESAVKSSGRRQSSFAPPPQAEPRRSGHLPSYAMPPEPLRKSQPIREAVNSAFTEAGASGAGHDPALVAAITQQVIKNLHLSGYTSPPSPAVFQATAASSANVPPRNVYTPPSPDRPPPSDGPRGAFDSRTMDGALEDEVNSYRPSARTASPPPTNTNRGQDEQSRPPAPGRAPTDDTTTLEKIWQPLFDKDGKPTARLGQFLRGLARQIIDDYEPQRSLVIAPHKMLKFYEEVNLTQESYPWNEIFGGKLKHSDLSHVYRDLDCEHHFIQPAKPQDKPVIPALTPVGFERWMTLMIQSHPDLEYDRLSKATLHMPISNADDAKERFPKELTRRLFPKQADKDARMLVDDSIYADGGLTQLPIRHHEQSKDLSREQSREPPRPSQSSSASASTSIPAPSFGPSASHSVPPKPSVQQAPKDDLMPPPPPPQMYINTQSAFDKDREHRSAPASETAANESSMSQPIERQRKPYSAAPGGGKVYEDGESRLPATSTNDESRPPKTDDSRPPKNVSVPQRSNTTSSGARPNVELDDYGVAHRLRSGSTAGTQAPPKRRYRSPSASNNPYSRSDTIVPPTVTFSNTREEWDNPRADEDALRRQASNDDRQRRYRPMDDHGNHAGRASYEDDRRQSRYDYPPPPPPRYP